MPGHFAIFPEENLAVFRYWGRGRFIDYERIVAEFPAHPDFSLELKHVVDLRDLQSYQRNPLRLMLLQARIAEHALKARSEILSVIIAPHPVAQKAARIVLASWEKLDTGVVRRIVENSADAADLVGLPPERLKAILETTRIEGEQCNETRK